ncbi:hypothetical protein P689_119175 [Candidatus Riesia pediculischaeffi PTSU]|uniref:Uncharacterized protein n=1 Tax=Candidatus Riesia pediculischaeffi PTSU TaxID=1401651 RepID=A0A0C1V6Z4_9ENTR|nr:hypothetical protein P689_119175 [Candidatus Riesia pediculischaeffi PTSU]
MLIIFFYKVDIENKRQCNLYKDISKDLEYFNISSFRENLVSSYTLRLLMSIGD